MASTDQINEDQEDFSISLSNPTNDAVFGSDNSGTTVFISDGNSKSWNKLNMTQLSEISKVSEIHRCYQVTPANVQVTPVNVQVTPINVQVTPVNVQVTPVNVQVTPVNVQVTPVNVQVTQH